MSDTLRNVWRSPTGLRTMIKIMSNAVSSPETVLNWNTVKKSYIRDPPPPYFIVLGSSVTIMEVKAIEFHIITIR